MTSIFKTPQGRAAAHKALPGSRLISGTYRKGGKYVRAGKSPGWGRKVHMTVRDRGSSKIKGHKGKESTHHHSYGFDQGFRKK